MNRFLKTLSFVVALSTGKALGISHSTINCTTDIPDVSYEISSPSTAVNGALSYCLKIPTLLSILAFSFAAMDYLGIHNMAAMLLSPLLGYIALEKVVSVFLLAGFTYWLKDNILTHLPMGTRIMLFLGKAESLMTVTISHSFRHITFLFEAATFAIELSLNLIENLLDKLFIALYLQKQETSTPVEQ